MRRWKILIKVLILGLVISACNLSRVSVPAASPSPVPASSGQTVDPTGIPDPAEAVPTEAPPETATLVPTQVIAPSPTWTSAPTGTPLPTQAAGPEPIVFGAGEVSAVKTGQVDKIKVFSIYALEGQIMQVVVRSETGTPALEVFSPSGEGLAVADPARPFWREILPATGEYRLVVLSEWEPVDFELAVLVAPPGETVWWTSYHDERYGFELDYPDTFVLGYADSTGGIADTTVVLSIPYIEKTAFEATNLRSADLSVHVGESPAALDGCLEVAPYEEGLAERTLDGVPFAGSWFGDAGAGNFYETRTYRAIHMDTCFKIVLILHSSNIAMFGSDTNIVEFDRAGVLEKLEEVLATFTFIP